MMRSLLPSVIAITLLSGAPSSLAAQLQVPDPARSTVSSRLLAVEGQTNGLPDDCSDGRCGDVTVVVRDFANNTIAGSSVVVDFSVCPDIQIACDQLNTVTGQVELAGRKVSVVTNAAGQVVLRVQGAANATLATAYSAPGARIGVPCAVLYADGVPLNTLVVAAYDLDGHGSPYTAVDQGDVAIVRAEALRNLYWVYTHARADYNGANGVEAADVAISAMMVQQQLAGTGSQSTGHYCP